MRILALAALGACTAPDEAVHLPEGTAPPGETTAPLEECTDPDACLFEGDNAFTVDGEAVAVDVRLPAEPRGAPVVFVWHFLGGSADEMLEWMGTDDLVAAGFVVVAPDSRGVPFTEWQVDGDPERNPDVALFDALRAQVAAQYHTDDARVYATGFSAGGLFTSYLTMFRGDVLAATAPFSGGVPSYMYASPAARLPVMLTSGGRGDTYGGFDFSAASEDFATSLATDGHLVVDCQHDLGHWLPDDAQANVLAFFAAHGGDGERAWAAGDDRVPGGCAVVGP